MRQSLLLTLFLLISVSVLRAQYSQAFFEEIGGIEILLENDEDAKVLIENRIYPDHGARPDHPQFYIGYREYLKMKELNIPFIRLEKKKPDVEVLNYAQIKSRFKDNNTFPLDFYPTYEAYEQMMYDFEANFPDLCRIINIGTLNSGRKLLVAHISSNSTDTLSGKANFFYTSTMHGDELAGFPIMLNLIDTLLNSYNVSDNITTLVEDLNIYINPLANPDGAYRNDNSNVDNAMRFNSQFIDLNRNYPDAERENPDGRNYAEETLAFVKFAEDYRINLSCNIHGGIELVNYPWDTWQRRAADDNWWVHVCRQYVDTVHVHAPAGYMTAFDNGVTNGWDWFEADGSRQDHITYFEGGREFTLEISNQKVLDSDLLPTYWNYNKASLLNYMHEARFGVKGTIIDCRTGEPVQANIFIPAHDIDNSDVNSRIQDGAFFRYLEEGSYDLIIEADGYFSASRSVQVIDKSTTEILIELCPLDTSTSEENSDNQIDIIVNNNIIFLKSELALTDLEYSIYDNAGRKIQFGKVVDKSIDANSIYHAGVYSLKLSNSDLDFVEKIFISGK